MAWFAELAGKAEHLLTNLDEQTGAALRNHSVIKSKKRVTPSELPPAEPAWAQRKRPIPRSLRKSVKLPTTPDSSSNYVAARKSTSPVSPKPRPPTKFNLNNCPKTLVEAVRNEHSDINTRRRRSSLPSNFDTYSPEKISYQIQNAMLKNELSVMSKETSDLIAKLSRAEEELSKVSERAEKAEAMYEETSKDKKILFDQLQQLKTKVTEFTTTEFQKYKNQNRGMETENAVLRDRIKDLEEKITQLNKNREDQETMYLDLENQLHHAKTNISNLENELEKSKEECKKVEADWETYKVRVRSMLVGKEKEIKALQQGLHLSEDTKALVSQIDNLKKKGNDKIHAALTDLYSCLDADYQALKEIESKVKHMVADVVTCIRQTTSAAKNKLDLLEFIQAKYRNKAERSMLSEAMTRVRGECEDMRQYMETLESRHNAAERVVVALRDALRDERSARNRAETQANSLAKELKSIQIEMGQTIASLRTALRDKEQELVRQVTSSTSNMRTSASSALNVADYEISRDTDTSAENDKVYSLTEKLMQRQKQVEGLLAENNMMKIMIDKFETNKNKQAKAEPSKSHSVVHFQDGRPSRMTRSRAVVAASASGLTKLSRRMGSLIRAFPLLRICIIVYMIFLQIWVITVLYNAKIDDKQTFVPTVER